MENRRHAERAPAGNAEYVLVSTLLADVGAAKSEVARLPSVAVPSKGRDLVVVTAKVVDPRSVNCGKYGINDCKTPHKPPMVLT